MKKLWYPTLVILALMLILAPAAQASSNSPPIVNVSELAPRGNNYIIDETGTLTNAQKNALNEKADAILQKRACAVYIWIVDLVPETYARSANTMEAYVDSFYEKYDLGYGGDKNGMVLLLEIGDVPGERDYFLNAHGACASVFSNRTREKLLDDKIAPLFKDAFSNGNFYRVAAAFLDEVEREFSTGFLAKAGVKLAAIILLPGLIALFVCLRWRAGMKTARIARMADDYIPVNGFNLVGQSDRFLYRTTTRKKIERSSSSSGGGSRSSSSGRSSGGKV